ncbi:MAG: preprotein translocase subunit YajC [Bacteroidota bacterium]
MNLLFFQGDPMGMIGQFLPLILIVIVMYFFFIRPQAKKQKSQQTFVNSLEKGKQVVTASGIIGTITKLNENRVTLKVSDKGYLEVLRSTISQEMTESL